MSDVIDVVLETTVIEIVQDGLVVEVAEEPVAIEIVTGTLPVTANQLDALNAADAPSATNPLLTRSAGDARYQTTPIADSDVPSTIARDSEVTAAIGAHAGAVDPHGDRGYAAGLGVNYDAAGAASTAVSNHVAANDPHGDRADATSKISTHNSLATAHGLTANISAALAAAASPGASNPMITRARMARFDVRDYGAVCDGVTDDSAAVIAAIAACHAAGGGTVFFPIGRTLVNSQIVLPHDAIVGTAAPHQRPIALEGVTNYINGQSAGLGTGGTRLILNYQGSGASHDAKIVSYGLATLTFSNIILQDTTAGPSQTPFVYVTNTTVVSDHSVTIFGTTAGATCQQDGFVFGGTQSGVYGFAEPLSPFQGYGTVVIGTHFDNIRRAVYGRKYCSQIVVRDCFFGKGCGTNLSGGACVEFDGSFDWAVEPAPDPLNIIKDNYFEVINYPYGIKLIACNYTTVSGNGFQDGQTGAVFIAGVRCEFGSTHNYIRDNFNSIGPTISEDATCVGQNEFSGPLEHTRLINDLYLNKSIRKSVPLGARVTFNTYSIPYNALTKVAFTVEKFDTDQCHDNVTDNTKLVCKTEGYYLVTYRIMWGGATGGRRICELYYNVTTRILADEDTPGSSGELTLGKSTVLYLLVGDTLELAVYHDHGGGLNIVGSDMSEFSMVRLV